MKAVFGAMTIGIPGTPSTISPTLTPKPLTRARGQASR